MSLGDLSVTLGVATSAAAGSVAIGAALARALSAAASAATAQQARPYHPVVRYTGRDGGTRTYE